jgi:hypothetical protein
MAATPFLGQFNDKGTNFLDRLIESIDYQSARALSDRAPILVAIKMVFHPRLRSLGWGDASSMKNTV